MLSAELWVDYPGKPGVLRGARIEVWPGEIFGLAGLSGSGKSTLALAILRLLDHAGARTHGSIVLLGRDVASCTEREMRLVRGRVVSMVPQSPASALNPALRIGTQLREAWRAHSREPWARVSGRVAHLLASAGLPEDERFLKRFPSEVSVGQAQRILIVMALLHSPALLIADEPTSALDLITQRDVLELILRIRSEHQMSVVFVSHDLPAIASICDRIAVVHEGAIVECGSVKEVLSAPKHPFTRQLVAAVPRW